MRPLFMVLLLLTASCGVAPGASDDRIVIGERHSMKSTALHEERAYWVGLPRSYNDGIARYPVLYLLDAEANFAMASGVVDFLGKDRGLRTQIPELILVGVPNTHRVRDLTPTRSDKDSSGFVLPGHEESGGAEDFLEFLEAELIPRIDADYRSTPRRILVGHSYGGLFALYALLERPGLFRGIVSIDPSLYFDDKVLVRRAAKRDASSWCGSSIYLSIADHPQTREFETMREGIETFSGTLERATPDLHVRLDRIEDESHETVGLLSLYHGLKFILPAGSDRTPRHPCAAPVSF